MSHPLRILVFLTLINPGWLGITTQPRAVAQETTAGAAPDQAGSVGPGDAAPRGEPTASLDTPAEDDVPERSTAEQITDLKRTIAEAEERLKDLRAEGDGPASEYSQAQTAFDEADSELEEFKKTIKELGPTETKAKKAENDKELARLEKVRKLAEERFDLAIEDRKAIKEQIATLEETLADDKKALDKLEGREPAEAASDRPTATAGEKPAEQAAPSTAPATSKPAESEGAAESKPGATIEPDQEAKPGATHSDAEPSSDEEEAPDQELVEAKEEAQTRAAASREAEAEARSATERLKNLDRDIELEKKLLTTARKQRDNAAEIHKALTDEFRQKSLEAAPRAELDKLLADVRKIELRHKQVSSETQEHSQRLEELQTERAARQAEQIDAMRDADKARAQVEQAEANIKRLENPFSLHNMLRWIIDHAPRMAAVVLAMIGGLWCARFFSQRVIRLLAQDGARGSSDEREARARTLVGVFHNAASMAIFVGGGLMILQESGIPIAPLLGGAAIFGLAIAFGAQNLIRDYFYGFVILLENQYKLNDVVQIGGLSGQVENITLRMTVLRDLEGKVHFVPNGEIKAVTNMTHGWSRALFDITVGYLENVDNVMAILKGLAQELRADPVYRTMILDDINMLGVDKLADSGVVIRFTIKTRALQQWSVKRELLRRIKNRFDELGIDLPAAKPERAKRTDAGTPLADQAAAQSRIIQGSRPHFPIS